MSCESPGCVAGLVAGPPPRRQSIATTLARNLPAIPISKGFQRFFTFHLDTMFQLRRAIDHTRSIRSMEAHALRGKKGRHEEVGGKPRCRLLMSQLMNDDRIKCYIQEILTDKKQLPAAPQNNNSRALPRRMPTRFARSVLRLLRTMSLKRPLRNFLAACPKGRVANDANLNSQRGPSGTPLKNIFCTTRFNTSSSPIKRKLKSPALPIRQLQV